MPIRINLLADAQAAEELRRKDPVKRAVWVAGFVVAVVLCWSASLQVKIMQHKSELDGFEKDWTRLEKDFKEVTESWRKANDIRSRLESLQNLTVNRFLWANVLDALQQVSVTNVALGRINTKQEYFFTEDVKAKTNATGVVIPGKPATSREKIVMTLEAKDYGSQNDGNYSKFVQALSESPYFKDALSKTNGVNLKSILPNQTDTMDPTRTFTLFTLDCNYPEKVR